MSLSGFLRRLSRGVVRRVRAQGRLPIVAALACLGPAGASADTVFLHNGDRLTGRILHLSPDALTLETTWAGEMKIRRFEVRAIETDKPVVVLRERADRTEWAVISPGDPGRMMLREVPADEVFGPSPVRGELGLEPPAEAQPATPLDVASRSIRYINPKPEESGEGVSRDGRINLSGALLRGNSNGERLYVESDFNTRARDWRYSLGLKARRERDAGNLVSSNALLSGNYDRFLAGSARFGYLRASLEADRLRDIDLRSTLGAGLGMQLLQTERTQLSVRGGLDAVDVRRALGPDESYPALGWGVNLSRRTSWFAAELFHDQTGFWNLDDAAQVTVRSRSGIRLPFVSGLTASLQLNLDWEGEPAAGRHATDASWLVGVGYAW
ncbi:MAG: DUF481 domain-containing protein [Burkholderiales bacterium]|nr:MAG: DUF481 domain-containing protein [Burkholderiales bacterium]